MKVLDLFSGIGGFSLGLERAGMETIAFCEIEKFPREVLKKHWPNVPIYEDVRNVTKKRLDADGVRPDIICGGFPCQDVSAAGHQKGFSGERTSLYGEMLRIVSECRPKYTIFENVAGLITGEQGRWFAKFLYDLAEVGYDAEWHCISAFELGAQHRRDRIWIIAYPKSYGDSELKKPSSRKDSARQKGPGRTNELYDMGENREADLPDTNLQRQERAEKTRNNDENWKEPRNELSRRLYKLLRESKTDKRRITTFGSLDIIEPTVCRDTYGVPFRMDRLKGLGNAVVPMIPELLGRAIMEKEK